MHCEPTGASCARWEKPRQRFDEGAPSEGGIVAVEVADLKLQRNGLGEAWKIGKKPYEQT
jgi:hypothetical protein